MAFNIMTLNTAGISTSPSPELLAIYTQIVLTQARVNSGITPGRDWWEFAANGELCANGKPINYWDAALDEAFEMYRSGAPFKWWSKVDAIDYDNTLVELVDVLHFLVSQEIVDFWLASGVNSPGYFGDPTTVARLVLDNSWLAHRELPEEHRADQLRREIKSLITAISAERVCWGEFWRVASCLSVTPTQIAAAYFAKAELNMFRQTHGYKTGHYIKVWTINHPGVEGSSQPFTETAEDNKILMDWVKTFTSLNDRTPTSSEIQSFLGASYHEVLSYIANAAKAQTL